MQGARVGPHRRGVEGPEGVVEHGVELEERVELVVRELVNERLGHGHRVRVQGHVDRADGLLVRRREVPLVVVAHGHDLVHEEVHFPAQRGHVSRGQVEAPAQHVDPLLHGVAAEVDGVALLVGVGLEHRQRVVVGRGEEHLAFDEVIRPGDQVVWRVARAQRDLPLAHAQHPGREGHRAPLGHGRGEARAGRQHPGGRPRQAHGLGQRALGGEVCEHARAQLPGPRRQLRAVPRAVEDVARAAQRGAGGGQAQRAHHRPGRVLQRPREGLREGLGVGRVLTGQRGDAAQVAQQPAHRRGEHVPRGARALVGDRQVARRRDARGVVGCAWCHGIASEDTVRP